MALAYTLPSYVEAKGMYTTRMAGDILDSSGQKQSEVLFCGDWSLHFQLKCLTSRFLSDL